MILVDAGALYALANRSDIHHASAVECLHSIRWPLVTHPLILCEAWYLLESRLGRGPARALAEQVTKRHLGLLAVEPEDLEVALAIEERYRDLSIGLTDAVSLALCERERFDAVFTFDRRDFGAFCPSYASALHIIP